MLKVKATVRSMVIFSRDINSQRSSLVLIGASVQGCGSPLIHAMIKCSLWVSSLPLQYGESSTIVYTMGWTIHNVH
jgi:predicted neutral ceramidase superfamily lipid hydrolase